MIHDFAARGESRGWSASADQDGGESGNTRIGRIGREINPYHQSACGERDNAAFGGMIRISDSISIDESEISESFIRASGPGGQNVNKVSTAVQLRFDVRNSPSLPDGVKARLGRLAGRRLTLDGVLVLTARRHRSQDRNRQDAIEVLADLIRRAETPPVRRRPTRPTLGSKERRLDAKSQRSTVKRHRSGVRAED